MIFGFIFGQQMYPEPPWELPIAYIAGSSLPGLIKTALTFLKDIDGDILYVIKPQLTSFGLALLKTWRKKKPIILDFESIKILSPGKYELDLVNLFNKKQPLIYKLEDGKYMIDLIETFKKITKNEAS